LKEDALDRTMWRARFGRGFGLVVRQTTKRMSEYYRVSHSMRSCDMATCYQLDGKHGFAVIQCTHREMLLGLPVFPTIQLVIYFRKHINEATLRYVTAITPEVT
jgi:hypothetical protein